MSFTLTFDEELANGSVRLRLPDMTPEKFWRFSEQNEEVRAELDSDGTVTVRQKNGGNGGIISASFSSELQRWTRHDGTGTAFGFSTLFLFPNRALRSPDAAWITNVRWDALSDEEQEKPVPFAPDFAVEILSPTDSLAETQAKMEEYKANGVRLGWLIDRKNRKVYIYRPNVADPEIRDDPASVSGDPELPGFSLAMSLIFPRRRTP